MGTKTITIRLPASLAARLKSRAEADRQTQSDLARRAITELLDDRDADDRLAAAEARLERHVSAEIDRLLAAVTDETEGEVE